MTDRTDFKKPRTPAEKMREIEERVATLEERIERQWLGHDTHRHEIESGSRFTSSALGPAAQPAHPGGIGECSQRFHGEPSRLVEQRQNPYRVPRIDDGVIGPGYHPLPAEPPGSPTVEEVEDDDYKPHQPRRECSVVFSENGKAWFLVSSEIRADEVMRNRPGATKHHLVELREGEEIVSDKALVEIARAMRENPDETAAERDKLASRVKELEGLAKALSSVSDHKEKAIEHLCAKLTAAQTAEHELKSENERLAKENRGLRMLLDEHPNQGMRQSIDRLVAERDQLQTRVAELEQLLSGKFAELETDLWRIVNG